MMAETDGILALTMVEGFENLAVDITSPRPMNIDEKYVDVAFDGTFFDITKGEKRPTVDIPIMPIHNDDADSKF